MFTQLSDNYFIWPVVTGLIIVIPVIFISMINQSLESSPRL